MVTLLDANAAGLVIVSPLAGCLAGVSIEHFSNDARWSSARLHRFNDASILRRALTLAFSFFAATVCILAFVPSARIVIGALFSWTLLSLAWWDINHGRLPDLLTLPLCVGGLAANMLLEASVVHWIAGAAIGFIAPALAAQSYRKLKGIDGLGGGDVKLFGAVGAWVGWEGLPLVLLLSSTSALAFMLLSGRTNGTDTLRFGPFIATAAYASWIWLQRSSQT
jgi:prepilin signal peptidase PulO-like enzyme (type II secretory pathway)